MYTALLNVFDAVFCPGNADLYFLRSIPTGRGRGRVRIVSESKIILFLANIVRITGLLPLNTFCKSI